MRVVVNARLPSCSRTRMAPSKMASTVTRERDCWGDFRALMRDCAFFIPNLKGMRVAEAAPCAAYSRHGSTLREHRGECRLAKKGSTEPTQQADGSRPLS